MERRKERRRKKFHFIQVELLTEEEEKASMPMTFSSFSLFVASCCCLKEKTSPTSPSLLSPSSPYQTAPFHLRKKEMLPGRRRGHDCESSCRLRRCWGEGRKRETEPRRCLPTLIFFLLLLTTCLRRKRRAALTT